MRSRRKGGTGSIEKFRCRKSVSPMLSACQAFPAGPVHALFKFCQGYFEIAVVSLRAHPTIRAVDSLDLGCRKEHELVSITCHSAHANFPFPCDLVANPTNPPIRQPDTISRPHRRYLPTRYNATSCRSSSISRAGAANCRTLFTASVMCRAEIPFFTTIVGVPDLRRHEWIM